MLIISQNCQGLGRTLTVQTLRGLVTTHHPTVVFLMETKNKSASLHSLRRHLRFSHSSYVEPVRALEGLAVWWTDDIVLDIRFKSTCMIQGLITSHNNLATSMRLALVQKGRGAACRMSQIHSFFELFSDCALMDLEFNGSPFTCSNNQRGTFNIRELFDRAVVTMNWRTLYLCAQVFHEI
ncbi:hypothetical protein ACSBR1_003670 [Camellia fascicularis]